MQGDTLFIAQTPLQLLNAIEGQKKFNKTGEFVLFYRQEHNRRRMQDLLDLYEIEQYRFFKITSFFRMAFIPRLFFCYASLKSRINTVFFGTYASWSSFLVNLLNPCECILVDDGNKTIDILENPERVGANKNRFLPVLSKRYLTRAMFFTFYADRIRSLGREAVQNSLEHVTKASGATDLGALAEDSIIFIGTSILPHYEGIDAVLNQILDSVAGRKVLYVMHRYDEPERLAMFQGRDNFEAVKFDYPLELVFGSLWRENKPEVWTFGTTAIDTLALIYPDIKVKVFELELARFISSDRRELFRSLYKYYRDQLNVDLVSVAIK